MYAEDYEDVIDKISRMLSTHYDIASDEIGPWSESSEIREQKEEADVYLRSFNISDIQNDLIQAII